MEEQEFPQYICQQMLQNNLLFLKCGQSSKLHIHNQLVSIYVCGYTYILLKCRVKLCTIGQQFLNQSTSKRLNYTLHPKSRVHGSHGFTENEGICRISFSCTLHIFFSTINHQFMIVHLIQSYDSAEKISPHIYDHHNVFVIP